MGSSLKNKHRNIYKSNKYKKKYFLFTDKLHSLLTPRFLRSIPPRENSQTWVINRSLQQNTMTVYLYSTNTRLFNLSVRTASDKGRKWAPPTQSTCFVTSKYDLEDLLDNIGWQWALPTQSTCFEQDPAVKRKNLSIVQLLQFIKHIYTIFNLN